MRAVPQGVFPIPPFLSFFYYLDSQIPAPPAVHANAMVKLSWINTFGGPEKPGIADSKYCVNVIRAPLT